MLDKAVVGLVVLYQGVELLGIEPKLKAGSIMRLYAAIARTMLRLLDTGLLYEDLLYGDTGVDFTDKGTCRQVARCFISWLWVGRGAALDGRAGFVAMVLEAGCGFF